MLTRLGIRNFKRLDDVEIELGRAVVLIGPNNSGKTSALQALALWDIGLRRWNEKRLGKESPKKRPGVTINRRDLISVPVPDANLLWRDLHVRNVDRSAGKARATQNVRIDVVVDGVTDDKPWTCGLEFDYANEESFYCRPLRTSEGESPPRMPVPPEAAGVRVAFLPPMSGLAATEAKLEPGRVDVLIGEGQTAQILRNLCYQIFSRDQEGDWSRLVGHIKDLFGVTLLPPRFIVERGEITMAYEEHGVRLDLSSCGRGLQQTLLLLAHLYANPGTVLLLDEPDAHLEILRQRQIYKVLTDVGLALGSQIVAASHSEVVLNEAADRDIVIAFVGKPHRIDDRGSQVAKSLREIGFEDYYLAEQAGWVLYLEGATDLAILRTLARTLGHPAEQCLERPFVRYVANDVNRVRHHFWGLREAKSDLEGCAIFDRLDRDLPANFGVTGLTWNRREIENYLCFPEVLRAYAVHDTGDDLFGLAESPKRIAAMDAAVEEVGGALRTLRRLEPWSADIKATDDFLDPLFRNYFDRLGLPNLLRKSDYHVLASLVPSHLIDREVADKLDAIVATAAKAKPRRD